MKKLKTVILVLLFFPYLGCDNSPKPKDFFLSVAIDKTEGSIFNDSADFILSDIKNTSLSDGIELSLLSISDTRYNSKESFVLEKGATGWMANDDSRRNSRRLLFNRFADSLVSLREVDSILNRSDIFRVVSKELSYLASKKGHRKLLLFSDLKEHSFFSVYNPKHLRLLYKSTSKVVSLFESTVALPDDLSGIEIVIIYKPSVGEDQLFLAMVELYKKIFESRGAIISVGHHSRITI